MGKLNLRSIMHRTWQVLVGRMHFQPLQSWGPGKALCPRPSPASDPRQVPLHREVRTSKVQGVLPTDILSADSPPSLSQPHPDFSVASKSFGVPSMWNGLPTYWLVSEQPTAS